MIARKETDIVEKKVVWITGVSSGIIEVLTREYNARGAFVVLSAIRAEVLNKVKKENWL